MIVTDLDRELLSRLGRRDFLRYTGIAVGAGVLAACKAAVTDHPAASGATPSARPSVGQEPGDLQVFDWTGYGDNVYGDAALWKPYKQQFPTEHLKYTVFKDDDSSYAKVAAGARYDIAHPCGYRFQDWVNLKDAQGGSVLQPWDTSVLTNFSSLNPSLEAAGVFDGKQYFVVSDWGFAAPMYNADHVTPKEDSWDLLWDDRYAGKISWWDSLNMLVVAGYYNGISDPWAMTSDELAQMRDFLISKKHVVRFMWTGADLDQAFKSGDVWVGYAWPASWSVGIYSNNLNLVYMQPKEGRTSWYCGFCLFAQTPNYFHAHDYVDAWTSPASGLWLLSNYAYGSTNTSVDLSKLDPKLVSTFSLDDPSVLQEPTTHVERPIANRQDYNAMWEQVKAS